MCSTPEESLLSQYAAADRKDTHSYAEPSKAICTHLDLSLEADFEKKILHGSASYDIMHEGADEIILDVKALGISKVTVDDNEVEYSIKSNDPIKGSALHIPLQSNSKKLTIYYSTTKSAEAVQWLEAIQTADKKHPFLFTQGQAILTRTWIPCQDSPGIRISYNAEIKVPPALMAVMSASNTTTKNANGVYSFEMKQAIPPYLIALAIGDLAFGKVGARTGVYAEPSLLKKSVYEFGEMEKMLELAEDLYGPYLWDRYDVIVLPPSFPFGGMENPRLTFATPTIIAGDRSLTSLIAHELAHSWSGNLVTNATWDDFWLNEGFTVYFENRIMEALYGKEYADMLSLLGHQDLEHEVKDLGAHSHDTHLKLNLNGRNPDDGMTDIAYEKGAHFLRMIESKVGRTEFDAFLSTYFEENKFKSMSTTEFEAYLAKNLLEPKGLTMNTQEWIYGPGIPKNCPVSSSNKFDIVEKSLSTFIENGTIPEDDLTDNWTTHEWLHFIRSIDKDEDSKLFHVLDTKYSFTQSGNSEIAAAWYEKAIQNGYYTQIIKDIERFLISVGRRKFLTPLYRALKEKGDINTARNIYAKAKQNYHSVSTQTMDALLLD